MTFDGYFCFHRAINKKCYLFSSNQTTIIEPINNSIPPLSIPFPFRALQSGLMQQVAFALKIHQPSASLVGFPRDINGQIHNFIYLFVCFCFQARCKIMVAVVRSGKNGCIIISGVTALQLNLSSYFSTCKILTALIT